MTAPTRSRTGAGIPIDPRIRERRVEVARAAGRRRLRVVLAALAALGATGLVAAATRSPLLDIDHVLVDGAGRTGRAAVVRAAAVDAQPLMVEFDTAAAARRIEALPWVHSAEVTKEWPNRVAVRVVERVAVAALPAARGWALVDVDGRILAVEPAPGSAVALAAPPARRRVGRVVPAHLRASLQVAAALAEPGHEALRQAVDAVAATEDQVGLQLRGGGAVHLGPPTAVADKLTAAGTVLASVPPESVAVLDVRVPSAPVLRRVTLKRTATTNP